MPKLELSDEHLEMQPGRKGEGRWQALVREFAASGKPSAAVIPDEGDVILDSIRVGLYNAVSTVGMAELVGISKRDGKVWLFRKDAPRGKAVRV